MVSLGGFDDTRAVAVAVVEAEKNILRSLQDVVKHQGKHCGHAVCSSRQEKSVRYDVPGNTACNNIDAETATNGQMYHTAFLFRNAI